MVQIKKLWYLDTHCTLFVCVCLCVGRGQTENKTKFQFVKPGAQLSIKPSGALSNEHLNRNKNFGLFTLQMPGNNSLLFCSVGDCCFPRLGDPLNVGNMNILVDS